MSKRRKRGRRGVSNAEMRWYLKTMSMTNKALVNDTEFAISTLIKHFRVPYERAETIARTFARGSR